MYLCNVVLRRKRALKYIHKYIHIFVLTCAANERGGGENICMTAKQEELGVVGREKERESVCVCAYVCVCMCVCVWLLNRRRDGGGR